jgi:hypothetical protein
LTARGRGDAWRPSQNYLEESGKQENRKPKTGNEKWSLGGRAMTGFLFSVSCFLFSILFI